MKTKFYLTLAAFLVSAAMYLVATFTTIMPAGEFTSFMQGFFGGLAIGAFIATVARGVQYRRANETSITA